VSDRDFSSITGRLQSEEAARLVQDGPTQPVRNLRSVQARIDAISRGDFDAVLADAVPGITFEIFAPPEFPWVRRAQGVENLRAAVAQNFGSVEDQRPEITNVVAEGETVVLFGREQGRIRETGRAYDLEFVQKFSFDDGRLVSVQIIAARAGGD
jgi:ketosteroid isomerase-like protein